MPQEDHPLRRVGEPHNLAGTEATIALDFGRASGYDDRPTV
ncbi:unannotated protein [freshwater metagenome]|uniref:Unannotated protein n=1 Tax=freshwater metagenome TaxID=449393 RepID=A0A6J7F568_9ZZZZ